MSWAFLLLWTMVAASIGLSLVSAFETYLGLVNFMPTGLLGGILAGVFTLAVQALLFVISWRIAQHLLDPIRSQIPSFLVWFICACFSGYFSYFGFFQQTGGRDENLRVDKVIETQNDVLRTIRANIETDLNDAFEEEFLKAPNYRPWITGLSQLITTAESIQPEIAAKARQREDELTAEIAALRQSLDSKRAERADAEAEVRLAAQRREDLQRQLEELTELIRGLRVNVQNATAEVGALETQLAIEGRTGQGPRYREIAIDLGTAQAKLEGAQQQLDTLEPRLDALRQEKLREDILAEQNIEQNKLNQILGDLDRIQTRIADATDDITDVRAAANTNFSAEREVFDQAQAQLGNREFDAYDQLVNRCQSTVRQITEAGLGDRVGGTRCSFPDLAPIIDDMRGRAGVLTTFRNTCEANRARPVRPETGTPKVDHVVSQLQGACTPFAVTPEVEASVNSTLSTFRTERGDQAIAYSQAGVALLTDWQSNAVIAAIFALIVDLLVLLCALVGRNVGLPETARAIDLIQAKLEMPRDQFEAGYERRLLLPEDGSNERALMQQVLLQLMSDELAVPKPGDENEIILFKPGTMARLKKMRGQIVRGAAQEAANAPVLQPTSPSTSRSARRRF